MDFPNRGIVQTGEGAVIVKNSLPGQKIRFCVNKVRKGKAEGRLLEVLEKSPLEAGCPCSHFGVCGGCLYLSLPYEEQLRIKEAQVKQILDGALRGQESPWRFEGIQASPRAYAYRNKMEFSFGDEEKGGPLTLGLHKRGSFYDVVTVEDCRIVEEDYRLILKTVRDYFAKQGVGYYHKLTHQGYLRHLLVRKASGTGEILAALVTTSQAPGGVQGFGGDEPSGEKTACEGNCCEAAGDGSDTGASERAGSEDGGEKRPWPEQELIQGFLESLLALEREGRLSGRFAGILHMVNDSQADVVKSQRTEVLYGRDYFYETLLGLRFKVSAFSFFQTNSYGAEVLYETAREYVRGLGRQRGGVIYDLYSGTGTIAQLMAPAAEKVIGVEIVEEAVEAARRNAQENGLANCEFIAGDVLKVLDGIADKPDLIILDPPRDGIHPKALPKIISYGVEHILYISCKPTSLARDLEVFLDGGYRVEKAVAVDQFPWTGNVEAVCLLSKLNVEHHIEVELNLDEMDLTAAEKKASYEEIKTYVMEHSGLKVSNLYIAQVKRKCGIVERENYNKAKAEGVKVPKCP